MIIIFNYFFLLNLLVIHWFEKVNYNNTLKHELSTAKIYEHNLFDERSDVDRYWCHMAAKVGVYVDQLYSKFSWLILVKLNKIPSKSRFVC